MAPNKQPTPEDRSDAIRVALTGLTSGSAVRGDLSKLGALHIRHNTFPAEELLELAPTQSKSTASRGLIPSTVRLSRSDPRRLSLLRETQHHKSKYAISSAAMIHGGVYPDLLDDAAWWEADDLWVYSFFAFLLYVRVAAERTGQSVEQVAR